MSKRHTPGPWTFDEDWRRIPTIRAANGQRVASVEKDAAMIVNPGVQKDLPERGHNARLIAAAPDMLAALKAVRPLLISLNGGHPAAKAEETMRDQIAMAVFETLDLALAKAEAQS